MRPWVVANKFKIFVCEILKFLDVGVEAHSGQWSRGAGELQPHLVQVIEVNVCVARGVDEVACLIPRHLRHHLQQESVGSDVEWYAQERVG